MNVVIYARYSSDLQRASSINDQIRVCEERAANEGWTVSEHYMDAGVSGSSLLRPGIQSLISALPKIDVVLCEALDRLSRDQADIASFFKHVEFNGVQLITLSEGQVSNLHIGLTGTMNQQFLKELGKKTHRGLRGRVEQGKSGGGITYGYNVITRVSDQGEIIRGEREINAEQAETVRFIFEEYALGKSARAIANELNKRAVPTASGKTWGASAIVGNRRRGTGIINNELYIGRLVWNKLRYLKDPVDGKRVSRLNPPEQWVIKDVPALSIIPLHIWQKVKDRQALLDANPKKKTSKHPKHLFSGLLECGQCGGGYSLVNAGQYGCSQHRTKGESVCTQKKTISRRILEEELIALIRDELLKASSIRAFVREYNKEFQRLAKSIQAGREQNTKKLMSLTKQRKNLIQSIAQGVDVSLIKPQLDILTSQIDTLTKSEPAPAPIELHNVGKICRHFLQHFTTKDFSDESLLEIRKLIHKVRMVLEEDTLIAELHGDLKEVTRRTEASGLKVAGAGLTIILRRPLPASRHVA